jgi:hypothetical protein
MLCGVEPCGWLVLVPCKHMGPCVNCLPPPPGMTGKVLASPSSYPTCLTCQQPVRQLIRMIL